jgi:hypothetical protein
MNAWLVIRHLSGSKAGRIERFAAGPEAELAIGRDPNAAISFDPRRDDVVSRRHAVIRVRPGAAPEFELSDLGSSNGTFVNGRRIAEACRLRSGDTVELGKGGPRFAVEVQQEEAASAPAAAARAAEPAVASVAAATPAEADETAHAAGPAASPAAEMPEGSLFISYAREDLAAVRTLAHDLAAAGITAWFDMEKLSAGDRFDENIRSSIDRCSLFLPILSRNTEARREAYFRREWRYALDRDIAIDPGVPFIVPVAIDDTKTFQRAPRRFLEVHITWLPQGRATPEFIARLRELLSQFHGFA